MDFYTDYKIKACLPSWFHLNSTADIDGRYFKLYHLILEWTGKTSFVFSMQGCRIVWICYPNTICRIRCTFFRKLHNSVETTHMHLTVSSAVVGLLVFFAKVHSRYTWGPLIANAVLKRNLYPYIL